MASWCPLNIVANSLRINRYFKLMFLECNDFKNCISLSSLVPSNRTNAHQQQTGFKHRKILQQYYKLLRNVVDKLFYEIRPKNCVARKHYKCHVRWLNNLPGLRRRHYIQRYPQRMRLQRQLFRVYTAK